MRAIVRKRPRIMSFRIDTIDSKLEYLMTLGFTHEEVGKIFKR